MKKTVYLFDVNSGIYAGECEIDCTPEGYYSLQSGMTEEAPPECPPGFLARRGMMGWELVAAEDLRRAAYEAEADVFRDQAVSYEAEAKALLDEGFEQDAHAAIIKATEARANYIAKKREIRERYPDAAALSAAAPMAAPQAAPVQYAVMPTGTYHRQGCSSVTDAAELMTPAEIIAGIPDAKPCGRCNPPSLSA